MWSVKRDSNPRPSGPKPDALPNCAIHRDVLFEHFARQRKRILRILASNASHFPTFFKNSVHLAKTPSAGYKM